MARKREEIKNEITDSFIKNETIKNLYGLTPEKTFLEEFSLVSFENILFDIVAYAVYVLELLFDQHNKEMDEKLKNQKRGSLSWYRYMALQFQSGFSLVTDSDVYDNTDKTLEEINASKIIKNAAVTEGDIPGTIVVKIAGEGEDDLEPIDGDLVSSVEAYFEEIKFAGNRISIINFLPDQLFLKYDIYIDPLILELNGTSIRAGGKPVELAIEEFKRELPFDGELILQDLTDKLQAVEGVKIAHLTLATTSWINPSVGGYGKPEAIDVKTIPKSGYFVTPNFNGINYVV